MYEHMAGIVPTSAGYATVDVKPQISKTLGPSSVNAAVKTVPTPTNLSTSIRTDWVAYAIAFDCSCN